MKVVKELKGHSESEVLLMKDYDVLFVRKTKDVVRNAERMRSLSDIVNVPKIYSCDKYLDMEYIHGLDMKQYLIYNKPDLLNEFIRELLSKLSINMTNKDYTNVYTKKLNQVDMSFLSFSSDDLIDRLPKTLPSSNYVGDLTMDNILFDVNKNRFVLIDPITSDYDSFVFDIAKLNQDLMCGWFLRHTKLNLDSVLMTIKSNIDREYAEYSTNKYLVILMLLRVLPYCKIEQDKDFIHREISRLWS